MPVSTTTAACRLAPCAAAASCSCERTSPPIIGLAIVVVAGLLSIWFLRENAAIAYAILAAAALIDAGLYLLFPRSRCVTDAARNFGACR